MPADLPPIDAQFRYAIARAEEEQLTARLKRVRRERLQLEPSMKELLKTRPHSERRLEYDLLGGQRVTLTYDEVDDVIRLGLGTLRGGAR